MMLRPEDLIEDLDADRLDESAAAALQAALVGDPAQCRALAREWRVHRWLALQQRDGDIGERLVASLRFARPLDRTANDAFATRLRQTLAARARRLPLRWAAVALLTITLVGGLMVATTSSHEPGLSLATVVSAHGAQVVRADGQRVPLEHVVRAGETVQTGDDAAALAWLDEPTALIIAPHSQLRLGLEAGAKRLHLEGGRVDAEVAPQPLGKPLVLSTRDATATVLGTAFSVSHDAAGTRLEVGHGLIRLRGMRGAAIEVATGQSATATVQSPATLSSTTRAPSGMRAGFDPPFVVGLDDVSGTNLLPTISEQTPLFSTDFSGVFRFQDRGPRPNPWHANSWLPDVGGVFELRDEPVTGTRAFCLRPTTSLAAVQAFFWPVLPLAAGRDWRLTLDYLTTPKLQAMIAIGLEDVRSVDQPLEPSPSAWRRIGCRIPAATQVRGFNLLLQVHGGGIGEALYFRDVRLVAAP